MQDEMSPHTESTLLMLCNHTSLYWLKQSLYCLPTRQGTQSRKTQGFARHTQHQHVLVGIHSPWGHLRKKKKKWRSHHLQTCSHFTDHRPSRCSRTIVNTSFHLASPHTSSRYLCVFTDITWHKSDPSASVNPMQMQEINLTVCFMRSPLRHPHANFHV